MKRLFLLNLDWKTQCFFSIGNQWPGYRYLDGFKENFLQNFGGGQSLPLAMIAISRQGRKQDPGFWNKGIREFFINYTDYLDEKAFEAAR